MRWKGFLPKRQTPEWAIGLMYLMQAAPTMRWHNSTTAHATLDANVGSAFGESIRRGQPAGGD